MIVHSFAIQTESMCLASMIDNPFWSYLVLTHSICLANLTVLTAAAPSQAPYVAKLQKLHDLILLSLNTPVHNQNGLLILSHSLANQSSPCHTAWSHNRASTITTTTSAHCSFSHHCHPLPLTSCKPQPHTSSHSSPQTPSCSSHPRSPTPQSAPRPHPPSRPNGNCPSQRATPSPRPTHRPS